MNRYLSIFEIMSEDLEILESSINTFLQKEKQLTPSTYGWYSIAGSGDRIILSLITKTAASNVRILNEIPGCKSNRLISALFK